MYAHNKQVGFSSLSEPMNFPSFSSEAAYASRIFSMIATRHEAAYKCLSSENNEGIALRKYGVMYAMSFFSKSSPAANSNPMYCTIFTYNERIFYQSNSRFSIEYGMKYLSVVERLSNMIV